MNDRGTPQWFSLRVRPAVAAFALLMEDVLRRHDGKDEWQDCNSVWLLDQHYGELRELLKDVGLAPYLRRLEPLRLEPQDAVTADEASPYLLRIKCVRATDVQVDADLRREVAEQLGCEADE